VPICRVLPADRNWWTFELGVSWSVDALVDVPIHDRQQPCRADLVRHNASKVGEHVQILFNVAQ